MSDRRDIQSLTIVHNILNDRAPKYLIEKIDFNHQFHDHNTRTTNDIRVTRARTNYGRNRFFRKYMTYYNDIKRILKFKSNISTATFKFKVKNLFSET